MNIDTMTGTASSIQISKMGNITSGVDFNPSFPFLIKNNSTANVTAKIVLIKDDTDTEITTTLLPGWNPEICKKVVNAPNNLQFGY